MPLEVLCTVPVKLNGLHDPQNPARQSNCQFDSADSAASISHEKLILVHAENARGKTTLGAILQSFATGKALPISERRRLGAMNSPQAVIEDS